MKKLLNYLISFLIIFSFLSCLFIGNAIATTYTICNFDSHAVGTTSGTEMHCTFNRQTGQRFEVDNTYSYSGDKSLWIRSPDLVTGSQGWINLTTEFTYISSITFYFDVLGGQDVGAVVYMDFEFYNDTDAMQIQFWYSSRDGRTGYTDSANVRHEVHDFTNTIHNTVRVVFTHINTNIFNISYYNYSDNSFIAGTQDDMKCTATWTNFTYIYIVADKHNTGGGDYCDLYLDDIVLISTTGEEEEYPTTPSCDRTIGKIFLDTWRLDAGYGKYVLMVYKNPIICDVTQVNLLVHANMYSNGATVSDFECKINEYDLGYASNYTRVSDYYWLVSWSGLSDIQIDGEYIWVLFKSDISWVQAGKTNYWAIGVTDNDIDGDSWIRSTYHNDDFYWNNFCNDNNYRELSISGGISIGLDVIYRLCISDYKEEEIYDYENDVICYPSTLYIGEQGNIAYTITSAGMGYTNYLVVNKSGVEYLNKTLTSQAGGFVFVPYSSGQYNATLWQNAVNVASDIFTVTGTLGNDYIYSIPSQTKTNENFDIYYKYPYTEYDGQIRIVKETDLIESFDISNDSEGTITTSLSTEGLHYLRLCINKDNTFIQINNSVHVVNDEHINFLDISENKVNVPKTITIFGSHSFVGMDVTIKDNGNTLHSVGNNPEFNFYEYVQKIGTHNFTLEVKLGTETIVLDYEILIASGELPIQEEERGLFYGLPLIFRVGMALALVVFVTFLPYMFLFVLSKGVSVHKEVKVPNIILLGFFIFSIALGIMLGLIEIYVLVMVIFVFVLYFVANYVINRPKTD